MIHRNPVCFADLAENLRLADHHRVERRCDGEEVLDDVALGLLVEVRADLLDASRILEEAALDKYIFQRDAYLQRRRSLVYDGQPPREKEPEDDNEKKPR